MYASLRKTSPTGPSSEQSGGGRETQDLLPGSHQTRLGGRTEVSLKAGGFTVELITVKILPLIYINFSKKILVHQLLYDHFLNKNKDILDNH